MTPTEKIRKWQRGMQDAVVRRNPRLGLAARAEFFVRLFEEHLPPGSRVLDIGGGWGFYAEPLERRGHRLTVLDVVKPGFQKAPVVVYDGCRIPFPDKSFDASLLVTVLHHISDPEAVIREARRVTRGILVVVEDVYRHWLGRIWTQVRDRILNFEYFGHPLQFRKKEEWVELFTRRGFSLLKESEAITRLAGFRILNSVLIFKTN